MVLGMDSPVGRVFEQLAGSGSRNRRYAISINVEANQVEKQFRSPSVLPRTLFPGVIGGQA